MDVYMLGFNTQTCMYAGVQHTKLCHAYQLYNCSLADISSNIPTFRMCYNHADVNRCLAVNIYTTGSQGGHTVLSITIFPTRGFGDLQLLRLSVTLIERICNN